MKDAKKLPVVLLSEAIKSQTLSRIHTYESPTLTIFNTHTVRARTLL